MSRPALIDLLVRAARDAFEAEWRALGSPSPIEVHAELEAARRVYHAVLMAAEERWSVARKTGLKAV